MPPTKNRPNIEKTFFQHQIAAEPVFNLRFPQFKKDKVSKFYRTHDVVNQFYGLRRNVKKYEQRNYASHNLERIHIDLMEFPDSPYPYCLLAIDNFSRKAFAARLKSKKGKEVTRELEAMVKIWKQDLVFPHHTITLLSDKGFELTNKTNIAMLDKYGIKLFTLQSSLSKASYAERLIRTLRQKLTIAVLNKPNTPWFILMPSIMKMYNDTPHSSLAHMTPNAIYSRDPQALKTLEEANRKHIVPWKKLQPMRKAILMQSKVKVHDYVRLKMQKANRFAKESADGLITREIFRVDDIKPSSPTDPLRYPMYKLSDLALEPVEGTVI